MSRLPEQVAILLAVADGGTDELLGAYIDAEEARAEAEAYNQRWSITPWEPNWQYVMQVPLTPPH